MKEIEKVQEAVDALSSLLRTQSSLQVTLASAKSAIDILKSAIGPKAMYQAYDTAPRKSFHQYADEVMRMINDELLK